MNIKAVSFDLGHTLIHYRNPLNWKSLYRPALTEMFDRIGIPPTTDMLEEAAAVLSKYNTREHPRSAEVSSDTIFEEIFSRCGVDNPDGQTAKEAFYSFFQRDADCYPDTEPCLAALRQAGMKIGLLTDVAYGMDNRFSHRDLDGIRVYFDLVLTSVDVGYCKPHRAGYLLLLQAFGLSAAEMLFVGDEEKDIAGANALGIPSVLINRSGGAKAFGQTITIRSLSELPALLQ